MTKKVNERELILGILMEVTEQGRYSHIVLREVLAKYQYLEKKERAFITRVTEGTIERMIELDYIIDQFSKVKVKKMKPVIRNILRSAVYQLKYMDNVPDSAVCNEAVKLTVRKGFGSLRGFVNGVLRSIARGMEQVEYPKDPLESLSIHYSMPLWMIQLWKETYDLETIESMLQAFLKETMMTVRFKTNSCKETEELIVSLQNQNIKVIPHPYLPYAFYLEGIDYLEKIPEFREGRFSVQDISSMMVCELAQPKEGNIVLDVCAAPGGKSIHMAEMLHGTGHVEARDLTEYKVDLIWDNIDRTGLENIDAVQWDALVFDENAKESADIVIADLPCSGLGVLGKKTDLKYKSSKEILSELVELQRNILSNVCNYVKPGGTLVYSTCTIHAGENEENAKWILEQFPEFELIDLKSRVCEELQDAVEEEGYIQFLPGIQKSDGFFIAVFQKRIR